MLNFYEIVFFEKMLSLRCVFQWSVNAFKTCLVAIYTLQTYYISKLVYLNTEYYSFIIDLLIFRRIVTSGTN